MTCVGMINATAAAVAGANGRIRHGRRRYWTGGGGRTVAALAAAGRQQRKQERGDTLADRRPEASGRRRHQNDDTRGRHVEPLTGDAAVRKQTMVSDPGNQEVRVAVILDVL